MPEENHRESSGGVIRFGDYELDPKRGVLSRAGFPLKIQPQPLRVLELLVTRAPEVVTREELSDSVWGNGVNVYRYSAEAGVSVYRGCRAGRATVVGASCVCFRGT